jgi:hypothetical protein
VIDEYKAYDADVYRLFDWIQKRLAEVSDRPDATIWLHPDSEAYFPTITQKLDFPVMKFTGDELAGHNELNWYLLPTELAHPFGRVEQAAHLYFLVDPKYLIAAEPTMPHRAFITPVRRSRRGAIPATACPLRSARSSTACA